VKLFRRHLRRSDEDFIDSLARQIAGLHARAEPELDALAHDIADAIAICLMAKGYPAQRVCIQCGRPAVPLPTNIGRRTAAGLGPPVCREFPNCNCNS